MLKGLFGFNKEQGASAPKNQIEVVCPACGAAQFEPRLVVSTFCKDCGVHLRIEKRRVIASEVSKAGGNPETLRPRRDVVTRDDAVAPSLVTPRVALAGNGMLSKLKVASGAASPEAPVSENGELGLGMVLSVKEGHLDSPEPVEASHGDFIDIPEDLGKSALDSGRAMEDSASGGIYRLRDQGFYRQQYFKEAQCFECDHKFKVGRSSRSVNCPQCGALISMEEVDLNMPSTQAIKTRGDVIVRKRGVLDTSQLHCRELRCFGQISAEMRCSGDAIFKANGQIVGEVHCRRFVVERGSEITFMNPIFAEEVEVHASITGNIFSKGQVLISANGAVNGDVTARSVSIEPGGELNGAMNIVRSTPPSKPLKPA